MKNTTRKPICLILAFSLITLISLGSLMPARAYVAENDRSDRNIKEEIINAADVKMSNAEKQKVKREVTILESVGALNGAEVVKVETQKKRDNVDAVEYTLKYGEYTNVISNVKETTNKKQFHCEQGTIKNDVVVCSDGTIFVNGKEIIIGKYTEFPPNEGTIQANAETSWYASSCPYGSPSSYSVLNSSGQCKDIRLRAMIRDITVSTFLSIVFAAGGVVSSLCATAAYSFIVNYAPQTSGLSYTVGKYQRPSGAYVVEKKMTILKCVYTWYTNINFWGNKTVNVSYYCRQYY